MIIQLIATALFVVFISHYLLTWTYWKRRGIKGPLGYPFLGVVRDLLDTTTTRALIVHKWSKKYGGRFGYIEGANKVFVVSELDDINEVFIKQFDNFYARKLGPGVSDKESKVHLFTASGNRWKRLRIISSPTFTNSNLRKLKNTVEDCVYNVLGHLEKKVEDGKPFEILRFYQEFTMDVIGRIALGQPESKMFENDMVDAINDIFHKERTLLFVIGSVFPSIGVHLNAALSKLAALAGAAFMKIPASCKKAVAERIKQREKDAANGIEPGEPVDFIDLFLDARADVDYLAEENEFTKGNTKVARQLSDDEIVSQCILFLIAGYDTTALSLTYASYLLAQNPEKMRKLQKEIKEKCPDPTISFDQLANLKYLDCVTKETLRLYPLASGGNSRRCTKTTKLGDTLIEKGTHVVVDTWKLHYDKNIWGQDADEFVPERWEDTDTLNRNGWMPFGIGPRQCVGMRLALMEEKLLLAHILRKYDFTSVQEKELHLVGHFTARPNTLHLCLTETK